MPENQAYPIKNERIIDMQEYLDFQNRIKQTIKEINTRYKGIYVDYKPSREERLFQEFISDIWKPNYEDNKRNESLMKIGFVTVFFRSLNPKEGVYQKAFPLKKLYPKKPSTTPMWYLLYHLAKEFKDCDIYLCPNIFYRNKDMTSFIENYVIASNAYFIDIDELHTKKPVYNMTQDAIKKYLKRNYPLFSEVKPKYILMSGRGLHLYFILKNTEKLAYFEEETKIRKVHKWVTQELISIYGADKLCTNLNRNMRIPYSTNQKLNINTRLYKTDDKGNHNLSSILEAVKRQKGELKQDNTAKKSSKGANTFAVAKKKRTSVKSKVNESDNTVCKRKTKSMGFVPMLSRRLEDLEKWFMWHLNDLKGSRDTFFFIYCNNLRGLHYSYMEIKERAEGLNELLNEPLPYKELDKIVYGTRKYYWMSNETVADKLQFTFGEQEKLTGVYSREEAERRKAIKEEEKAQRKEERLEKNRIKRRERMEWFFDFIRQNPDADYKQMAAHFGISLSYSKKLRKKYKDLYLK